MISMCLADLKSFQDLDDCQWLLDLRKLATRSFSRRGVVCKA